MRQLHSTGRSSMAGLSTTQADSDTFLQQQPGASVPEVSAARLLHAEVTATATKQLRSAVT